MSDKIRISGSVYIEKKLFAKDRGILAYLSDEGHARIIRFCMEESQVSEQRNLLLSYFRYLTTELGLQEAYKLFERLQPVLQKEMKDADPSVRKLVLLSDECEEPSLGQLEDRPVKLLIPISVGSTQKRLAHVKIPSGHKGLDNNPVLLRWVDEEGSECKLCGCKDRKTAVGILTGLETYIECCMNCSQEQKLQNIVDTLLLKEKSQCCDDL